ncbi:MAG TPA: hypothetical protein DEB31_02320, partial [Clostridiales bacterium]|nr:hypothetical protein [Clostridiales bacterium]
MRKIFSYLLIVLFLLTLLSGCSQSVKENGLLPLKDFVAKVNDALLDPANAQIYDDLSVPAKIYRYEGKNNYYWTDNIDANVIAVEPKASSNEKIATEKEKQDNAIRSVNTFFPQYDLENMILEVNNQENEYNWYTIVSDIDIKHSVKAIIDEYGNPVLVSAQYNTDFNPSGIDIRISEEKAKDIAFDYLKKEEVPESDIVESRLFLTVHRLSQNSVVWSFAYQLSDGVDYCIDIDAEHGSIVASGRIFDDPVQSGTLNDLFS